MNETVSEMPPQKQKRQMSTQGFELRSGFAMLVVSIPFGAAGIPARVIGSALVGDAARRASLEYIERRAADASAKLKKKWYDKMYAFLGKDTKLSRLVKHGISIALGALVAVGAFMLTELLAEKFTAYAYGGQVCHAPFGSHEVICPVGTPAGLHCAVHPMDPTNYFYYECPAPPPPHIPPPHVPPPPPPHAPPLP